MTPKDPVLLLSFVNLKLRDYYPSLQALCEDLQLDQQDIITKLQEINYHYHPEFNQFKANSFLTDTAQGGYH